MSQEKEIRAKKRIGRVYVTISLNTELYETLKKVQKEYDIHSLAETIRFIIGSWLTMRR
jgi:hypothetical protein